MATSNNGHQDNHHTGQGQSSLPGLPGEGDSDLAIAHIDQLVASEVMALSYEVTLASAEIYEFVATLSECLVESLQCDDIPMHPDKQNHVDPLLNILRGIQKSEVRIRLLESKMIDTQSDILGKFLQDCWTALGVFNEASRKLAGVIGIEEWATPQMTDTETLIQVMERLDTCSVLVSGLSATGMAVGTRCLMQTAFSLQSRAGDLARGSTGSN